MMAIRALILGMAYSDVAKLLDTSERTLGRWVKAFNQQGIDGLLDSPRPGRPRALAPESNEQRKTLIENPKLAGEVFWTAKKFHGYLTSALGEEVGYSTVIRWLHEQNFRLLVPRPWPDRQDDKKRTRFLKQLTGWLGDDSVELWYGDESGFEGDPRPRRRWAQVGSSPTRVKNGDHLRSNVIGGMCPRTGEFCGIEVPSCDSASFQVFLNEANSELTFERPTNLLIVDNASWHKTKNLDWGKFTPIFLPPYSPDFNPIERLWLLIKNEWFSDFIAKNRPQLSERISEAVLWTLANPDRVQKMCSIKTKL